MSYRARDGTLKILSTAANARNHSIAGKSQSAALSIPQYSSDDEEKPLVYDPEPKTDQEKQRMLKKTKNNRQAQMQHKNTVVLQTGA